MNTFSLNTLIWRPFELAGADSALTPAGLQNRIKRIAMLGDSNTEVNMSNIALSSLTSSSGAVTLAATSSAGWNVGRQA